MNNNCITTYTGRHIDPLHPDPDMICIEDIAHALSLICRGNGQVKTFFSVGQHCINCARAALCRFFPHRTGAVLRSRKIPEYTAAEPAFFACRW